MEECKYKDEKRKGIEKEQHEDENETKKRKRRRGRRRRRRIERQQGGETRRPFHETDLFTCGQKRVGPRVHVGRS